MTRRRKQNRGAILLVVLSLLVLFALAGVTFALIAGYYRRSAEAVADRDQKGDKPSVLLDQAMYVLLRDTTEVNSPLRGHSLLADMYGDLDSLRGFVGGNGATAIADVGGQFIELEVDFCWLAHQTPDDEYPFSRAPDVLAGRVLTFLEGPWRNVSLRIVSDTAVDSGPLARRIQAVLADRDANFASIPQAGDDFLINGRPFDGTGAGLPRLEAETRDDSGRPERLPLDALHPNGAGVADPAFIYSYLLGGVDEAYDLPDYNNMALSGTVYHQSAAGVPLPVHIPSFVRPALMNYHYRRREGQGTADPITGTLIPRTANMRARLPFVPNPQRGPAEQALALINGQGAGTMPGQRGQWDVDNDNDGIPDSVWIDMGLPIQTTADGRHIKPLVAFLVRAMDNRLNLNTHGYVSDVAPGAPGVDALDGVKFFGNLQPNVTGQSYGPAEIALTPLLGNNADFIVRGADVSSSTDQSLAVQGFVPGRETLGNLSPQDAAAQQLLAQQIQTHDVPHAYAVPRANSGELNTGLIETNYAQAPDLRAETIRGVNHYGITVTKTRTMRVSHAAESPYGIDHSRTANRSGVNASAGNLYSAAELESLLRYYDVDSRLGPERIVRLLQAMQGNGGSPNLSPALARHLLTTESFHVPVPHLGKAIPQTVLRTQPQDNHRVHIPAGHISDLLRTRAVDPLAQALETAPPGAPGYQIFASFLAPELMRGELMNINRPFGNGVRDTVESSVVPEQVVDVMFAPGATESAFGPQDTAAIAAGAVADPTAGNPNPTNNVPFDHTMNIDVNGNGNLLDDGPLARHLYARHLYVLMMMIYDVRYDPMAPRQQRLALERIIEQIAQFAVNVVDYRDADSVMTPFEYDLNPFDGWNVDGIPTLVAGENPETRRVVWGCERPELLITETLAVHQRRSQDTDQESLPMGEEPTRVGDMDDPMTPEVEMPDEDYDQQVGPLGQLFIEIYNPWRSINDPNPREFYARPGYPTAQADRETFVDGVPGIDLQKIAELHYNEAIDIPDGQDPENPNDRQDERHPVWRILIVKGESHLDQVDNGRLQRDPDDFNVRIRNNLPINATAQEPAFEEVDIDRIVYFTKPNEQEVRRLNAVRSAAGADTDDQVVNYYPSRRLRLLQPGQHAVIGSGIPITLGGGGNGYQVQNVNPRTTNYPLETYFAAPLGITNHQDDPATPDVDDALTNFNVLRNQRFLFRAMDGTPTAPFHDGIQEFWAFDAQNNALNPDRLPAIPIPIDMTFFARHQTRFGRVAPAQLNISEPKLGYETTLPAGVDYNPQRHNGLGGFESGGQPYTFDVPFDNEWAARGGQSSDEQRDSQAVMTNGTTPFMRTLYLQRLADPMKPLNLETNPYLTIDRAYVDLTSGNGVEVYSDDPLTAEPFVNDRVAYYQRQRGQLERTQQGNLWKCQYPGVNRQLNRSPLRVGQNNRLAFNVVNTLGQFGPNSPFGQQDLSGDLHTHGSPAAAATYPSLNWGNRPFNNVYELTQVPRVRSSLLPLLFDVLSTSDGSTPYQVVGGGGVPGVTGPEYVMPNPAFSHLPNLFGRATQVSSGQPAFFDLEMHRLFDYIGVPSRYAGSSTVFNPVVFGDSNNRRVGFSFRPPFNRISNFREPGRLNINMIDHPAVWEAFVAGRNDEFPTFNELLASVRGYTAPTQNAGAPILAHYPVRDSIPTMFANPFRPQGQREYVPKLANGSMEVPRDVDATIMRRTGPVLDGGATQQARPMFENRNNAALPAVNQRRNSAFRYSPLERVKNLTAPRSNVYAVWITVGYFEVNPSVDENTTPGQFRLGSEYLLDTGENQRHRAFYMIDRSIPVAYQRGQNHNVDRAIVLRRIID